MGRSAERRQHSWDVSVRWARQHPKLSAVALVAVGIMSVGSLLFAVAASRSGQWGEALFWIVSAGYGVWVFRSWVRIRRGELRPTTWRG